LMTTVMRAGDNATSDAVSTRSSVVVADPPPVTFRIKSTSSPAVYITTAGRKSASATSSSSKFDFSPLGVAAVTDVTDPELAGTDCRHRFSSLYRSNNTAVLSLTVEAI